MPDTPIQVLLVEDNPGDARLLREELAGAGPGCFRVHHAGSLGVALSDLERGETYDVILLDLSLPDSSGLETVARMHGARPHLPIVVLTGLDDEQLGIEAIRGGAQDYLIKGQVDSRLLARTVRYAVQRKGLEAERDRLIDALRHARDELELRVQERTADLRETVKVLQAAVRARTRAEEALRASETRLRLLLQQIPAIVWTTDGGLRLTSSYGTGPAVFTLQPNAVADDAAPAADSHHPILASHRRALQGESLAYEAQWKGRVYQCHVEPLRTAEGMIVGCLGIALDITEHRQLEEQRAKLQEQIHQAHKVDMIGRLAAGLGHDFGNVLATVSGYASLARTHLSEGHPAVEALDTVEEAARQARGITNALLSFGRQMPLEKGPVNLCAVMEESGRLLRHAVPATIELTTRSCDPPLWVRADPVQLQQVLLNLAINARDAMLEGGELEISISPASQAEVGDLAEDGRHPADFACLVVRDTGEGMAPEVQPRIFDPFFTTKRRGQGSGLGLSIVHGIVEDLGGRIQVASVVGKGTVFTIVLPCVEPPPPLAEAAAPGDAAVRPGGVILLVDANRHARGVMGAVLGSLGYDVVQAADIREMAACYNEQREKIRLLILAREVLGAGETERVPGLSENGNRVPVILIADETGAFPDETIDADVTVLRRPFQMPQLKELVCDILGA